MFIIRLDPDQILAREVINTNFSTQHIAEDPTRRPIVGLVLNSPPIERYSLNTVFVHNTSNCVHFLFFCGATFKFSSFDLKY